MIAGTASRLRSTSARTNEPFVRGRLSRVRDAESNMSADSPIKPIHGETHNHLGNAHATAENLCVNRTMISAGLKASAKPWLVMVNVLHRNYTLK